MSKTKLSSTQWIFLVSFVLFLSLLPAALYINFYQNDDWVYYKQIEEFLSGNFLLLPQIAPTFYTQGLLGLFSALIFGVSKLPILTLLISVLNFAVFCLILNQNLKKTLVESLIVGSMFFTNLLFVYSMWGFMTENYFLLFILLALYLFPKNYFSSNLAGILAFFTKQVGLAFPIALGIYYFFKKDYKKVLSQIIIVFGLFAFYAFIFPKTEEMVTKPVLWDNFFEGSVIRSFLFGIFILLTAYALPLLIHFIYESVFLNKNIKNMVLFAGACLALFVVMNRYFHPEETYLQEFPYFGNTVERKGFFQISGTKYHFYGIYDLYKYWDLAAKVTLVGLIGSIFVYQRKKEIDLYSLFMLVYIPVILVSERLYDRYILILLPVFMLFMCQMIQKTNKFWLLSYAAFVIFMTFMSYQFSSDFLISNKYMWQKSRELVNARGVDPKMIKGPNAWKLTYRNLEKNYLYEFSYDSFSANPEYMSKYDLVEEFDVNYPLNFFVNSRVFLYRVK